MARPGSQNTLLGPGDPAPAPVIGLLEAARALARTHEPYWGVPPGPWHVLMSHTWGPGTGGRPPGRRDGRWLRAASGADLRVWVIRAVLFQAFK